MQVWRNGGNSSVISLVFISSYIHPQKKIYVSYGPQSYGRYSDIFSEALSVSPRVSTSDASFVLKGMARIMNLDDW